jgi:PEP-CTERM motif
MTSSISLKQPVAQALSALFAVLTMAAPARAVPLEYWFTGVTGAGSLVDFGHGVVSVEGVSFTITGRTVDDVDLTAVGDGFGAFQATSTYDFGGFGSFQTKVGGDVYFQNCHSPAGITCVGLFDPFANAGFLLGFAPIAGNPDHGLAIGTPTGAYFAGASPRYLANGAGQQIYMQAGAFTNMAVVAVPEPHSVALFLSGLAALAWRRRVRR